MKISASFFGLSFGENQPINLLLTQSFLQPGRALLQLSAGNPVLHPIRDNDSNLMKGQTLTQICLLHIDPLKVNWSKYNLGNANKPQL